MSEPTDPKRPSLAAQPAAEVDPDAPASAEELAAAAALRDALEPAPGAPPTAQEEADLLRALALADSPRELPAAQADALVARALETWDARRAAKRSERRGVVVRVAFGAATLALAAAAVLLFVGRPPGGTEQAALVHVRSTQPLFDQPFERGQASARADRIATARAADLRENRFAMRGVR
jgi:hypothetical protein